MLTQVLVLQLPISMHWWTGSLAPKYEEVKLASTEEGMAVNLHAGHDWAPQVACPPARVEESCSTGTRWRQVPNSEGQTWLHKVSLVGSPLLPVQTCSSGPICPTGTPRAVSGSEHGDRTKTTGWREMGIMWSVFGSKRQRFSSVWGVCGMSEENGAIEDGGKWRGR